MDRRQFITRSAALVAISALPLPQAQAAVQPQLASGLIRHMHFRVTEPVRLVLDGPLAFADCYFENLVPGSKATILFSLDDEPWRDDVAFEIKSGAYPWAVAGCAVENAKGFTAQPGVTFTTAGPMLQPCEVL